MMECEFGWNKNSLIQTKPDLLGFAEDQTWPHLFYIVARLAEVANTHTHTPRKWMPNQCTNCFFLPTRWICRISVLCPAKGIFQENTLSVAFKNNSSEQQNGYSYSGHWSFYSAKTNGKKTIKYATPPKKKMSKPWPPKITKPVPPTGEAHQFSTASLANLQVQYHGSLVPPTNL